MFADHLGPSDELSEGKLAELYEQLGRDLPSIGAGEKPLVPTVS
jgi:hypothetical protein